MSTEQYLRIAKIVGAHGLKGFLKIKIISDFLSRFNPGTKLYLKIGADYIEYVSNAFTEQKGKASLIKLEGINDRDHAISLRGIEIFIKKADAEESRDSLEKNTFYYYDLIGCQTFWNDEFFAEVIDIIEAGDGCVLVLKDKENKEYLIPFNKSMVDTEKIMDNRIDIYPIEGLFEK